MNNPKHAPLAARFGLGFLRFISTTGTVAFLVLCSLTATAQVLPQTPQLPTLGNAPYRDPLAVPPPAGFQPQVLPQQPYSTLSVDISTRHASRNFFNSVYGAADGVPPDWTGSVAGNNPGDTSQDFKDAVVLRINSLRALAGVPAVITLNPTWNSEDQQAALMFSANNDIEHVPPTNWIDYTSGGATAAGNSNIFLSEFGPTAMTGYVFDFGGGNPEVGHRRWLLYPPTQQMGTGDVPPNGSNPSANALWVFDSSHPYPTVRDTFVAWPPKGYVPYQLIFPRWSFSLRNAGFANAAVSVTLNGNSVTTTFDSKTDTGFGDNTLVWHLNSTPDGSPPYPKPGSDQTYVVTVSGVTNTAQSSYTYSVIVFDPATTGPDDKIPVLSNPGSVGLGSTTNIAFTPLLPEATGYEVWSGTLQTATWVEGAEVNPPLHLTTETTGSYSPIISGAASSGSKSFHLVQDGFNNQDLLLNSQFVASANSSITFKSRYGGMFPAQLAEVQVSTDDGASWANAFVRAGDGNVSTTYVSVPVSLAAYANRIIRIRFLLEYTGGGAIADVNTATTDGWIIDDITPVNLQEASNVTETAVASSPYSFVAPNTIGTVPLAVRALLFNAFPVEFGPITNISVIQSSNTPVITSPSTASGTYGVSFTGYTETATSTGPISYGADNLPPGLSIDSSSGVISGTPTQAGTFGVTLKATNTNTSDLASKALTFTIAKATATVNVGSLTTTYDGTAKTASASTAPNVVLIITYNGSTTAPKAAGSYTVVATISDTNYQGSGSNTLVISPATLTVGLTGTVSKGYDGTTAATLTSGNYSLSAPVGGDQVSLGNFTSGTFIDKNVGTGKQVTVSGLSLTGGAAANYQLNTTTLSGSIGTISMVPLTVTASSVNKVYDGKPYTGSNSATFTGFVHGETSSVLGGSLTFGGTWQGALTVGSYTIIPGGLTSSNYTITPVNGTLSITGAPITVTIKAGTSVYGQNLSAMVPGLTVTGLLNGDMVAALGYSSVITGTGSGITSATDAGKYGLTITGGLTNSNYALKSGTTNPVGRATTWTVSQATLTVSGLTGTSVYGQSTATPVNLFTLTSTNGVTDQAALFPLLASSPTTTAYAFNITSTTNAGTYTTDTVTAAFLNAAVNAKDYKLVIGKKSSWTVTPDIITIAGMTSGSSTYGFTPVFDGTTYFTISDQNNTPNVASFVSGAKATLTATASSVVGTYSVATAGTLKVVNGQVNGVASANYKVALAAGSWKVTQQPVAIAIATGSSVYGAAPGVPVLTATGSVAGKNVAVTSKLLPGLSTNQLAVVGTNGKSGVGAYAITLTGTPTGNYTYTGQESDTTGTWHITPATISALKINTKASSTVGSNPIDAILTATGLASGDKADVLGYIVNGQNGILTSATGVGTYTFTVGGSLTNGNYVLKAGLGNPPATPAGAQVTIK